MKWYISICLFLLISFSTCAQYKLYEKGYNHYKAERYDQAIASLSEYLTKGTRDKSLDIEVFYIRALSYYKLNKYQSAVSDFQETILLNHHNKGNIYWFLAKCHDNLNESDDAISNYTNSLRLLSAKPETTAKLLYDRSVVHTKAGNQALAEQDIIEAYKLHPQNEDVANAYEEYKKRSLHKPVEQKNTVASTKESGKGTTKKGTTTTKSKTPEPTRDQNSQPILAVTKEDKSANTQTVNSNTSLPGTQQTNPPVQQVSQNAKPSSSTPVNQPVAQPQPQVNPLAELYKDEKRYALVIGNSSYSKQIGELKNPVNDASDIAAELKSANFDVQLLTNATYGQIRAALMKFKDKIDAGDREKTVALFYYAGHGLAFEDENYLVPVDASVEYQDDIPRYCFPIQRMVLANMERSNARMNIVILDACRNNPFPAATRSAGGQGLTEMRRAKGSFIAYATAPGSVASDGNGRNGLYTQELLKAMKKPGLTIEQVFKEVRANVLKQSNDRQNTWDSSNIIGDFYFRF